MENICLYADYQYFLESNKIVFSITLIVVQNKPKVNIKTTNLLKLFVTETQK